MKKLISVLLLALLTGIVSVRAADFQTGVNALVKGDFETGYKHIRPLAEQGHLKAQFFLGLMYKDGDGVSKDADEARYWLRKAAEVGHLDAQDRLGDLYSEEGKKAKAVEWYRKAAEKGHKESTNSLGYMLRHGIGVQADPKQALRWFRRAAKAGNPYGYFNIGTMYEDGKTVPRDLGEALKWYKQAAEAGNSQGQAKLGYFHATGNGPLPQDNAMAYKWWKLAAQGGNQSAADNLKMLKEDLSADDVAEGRRLVAEFKPKKLKAKKRKASKKVAKKVSKPKPAPQARYDDTPPPPPRPAPTFAGSDSDLSDEEIDIDEPDEVARKKPEPEPEPTPVPQARATGDLNLSGKALGGNKVLCKSNSDLICHESDQENPYSGRALALFHGGELKGSVKEEYTYRNGVKDGPYKKYDKNTGFIIREAVYGNGKLNGPFKEFDRKREGVLTCEGTFKDSMKEGWITCYGQDGKPWIRRFMVHGNSTIDLHGEAVTDGSGPFIDLPRPGKGGSKRLKEVTRSWEEMLGYEIVARRLSIDSQGGKWSFPRMFKGFTLRDLITAMNLDPNLTATKRYDESWVLKEKDAKGRERYKIQIYELDYKGRRYAYIRMFSISKHVKGVEETGGYKNEFLTIRDNFYRK